MPVLTKMYDYQAIQFSVRPMDMKLAFGMKGLIDTAMCATISLMAERLEALESHILKPTDDSICIETAVENAIAPLIQSQGRPVIQAARRRTQSQSKTTVSAPDQTKQNTKSRKTFAAAVAAPSEEEFKTVAPKARRKTTTVTGSSGDYVGPKSDKYLKVQVDQNFTQEKVQQAVVTATGCESTSITVEPLTKIAKNYAMSYRVKIEAIRVDHAANLLQTHLWPSGMVVSNWTGLWLPLKQRKSLKLFVGNLHESAHPATIVDRVKTLFENAGVPIASATSEKFVGKKVSTRQNLIVTLEAQNPGITLEPIQEAKLKGKVPPGIFIRVYGETAQNGGQTWE